MSLLTLGALAVRVDRLRGPEGRLSEDESRLVLAARGVAATGRPVMPSGKVYLRGVLSSYLTAASLRIFGPSDRAARWPNTILGALLVPVLFLFGRALAGTALGLGAACFAVAQPELVQWSASAWMTSLFIVIFVAALLLLHLGYERDRPRLQVAGALAAVAAVLAHELGALLAGAVALFLVLRAPARRRAPAPVSPAALVLLGLGLVVFGVLGLQLRAATLSGPTGEFRHYFGPSLSPERFLLDYQRWREAYPALVGGAVAGLVALVATRGRGPLLLHSAMAVTCVTVWGVIGKTSERYGLVLLPLLALAGGWGLALAIRAAAERLGAPASTAGRLAAAAVALAFGLPFLQDLRAAQQRWGEAPERTWLTELQPLAPGPRDAIVSDNPEIPAVYLGRVDYWERQERFERYAYRSGTEVRHLYTGARRIADEGELMDVIEAGAGRTVWYVGRGAFSRSERVRGRAALVHATEDGETIMKFTTPALLP